MDIFLIIQLWLCGRLVNAAFWAALLLQASFLMWFLFLFNMQAVQNLNLYSPSDLQCRHHNSKRNFEDTYYTKKQFSTRLILIFFALINFEIGDWVHRPLWLCSNHSTLKTNQNWHLLLNWNNSTTNIHTKGLIDCGSNAVHK